MSITVSEHSKILTETLLRENLKILPQPSLLMAGVSKPSQKSPQKTCKSPQKTRKKKTLILPFSLIHTFPKNPNTKMNAHEQRKLVKKLWERWVYCNNVQLKSSSYFLRTLHLFEDGTHHSLGNLDL